MFAALDIPYRSVDLDSAANQQGDWGGRVRRALQAQTKSPTIPQIFIGGAHIGGCTDLFNAWRDGSIQQRLADNGIHFDVSAAVDPYSLLPKWLHPRKTA
jgi:cysteine synthase A